MANRAKPKKSGDKKKTPAKDPRQSSRGKVAKAAPKRGKRGDNSGDHGVPDEVYERHLARIDTTSKAMDKAKETYDQAKGVHQSAYKAAKEDGCDTDAIRLARKLDKQDAGVTQIIYANVSRVLNLMNSALGDGQMDLFGSLAKPEMSAKVDPYAQGLRAGRAAEDVTSNGHKPGSDEFNSWAAGYEAGQQENREKFTQH